MMAKKKQCYRFPTCQNEPLVYHCVRFSSKLVEVCAPRGLITGGCCALFDDGLGRVVADFYNQCTECPFRYFSNETLLYSSCVRRTLIPTFKTKMHSKEDAKRENNSISTEKHNERIGKRNFIFFSYLVISICILVFVFVHSIKRMKTHLSFSEDI
ncbi:uncharacterized protein LOC144625901 isoform X2 [Crassostrea virginica]